MKNCYSSNTIINNKSGVFTLGITFLHMLTLRDMSLLYNYNSHSIDQSQLNSLLEEVEDMDLQLILKKMLKIHTYERITFT
jgi:hypothetical protein